MKSKLTEADFGLRQAEGMNLPRSLATVGLIRRGGESMVFFWRSGEVWFVMAVSAMEATSSVDFWGLLTTVDVPEGGDFGRMISVPEVSLGVSGLSVASSELCLGVLHDLSSDSRDQGLLSPSCLCLPLGGDEEA